MNFIIAICILLMYLHGKIFSLEGNFYGLWNYAGVFPDVVLSLAVLILDWDLEFKLSEIECLSGEGR